MFEIKRQKKSRGLLLSFHEVPQLPIHQNKKRPRYARGRFPLIFMVYFLKFCGFHETKNKQKRFFMSLKFNFAQTTIFYILFTTF